MAVANSIFKASHPKFHLYMNCYDCIISEWFTLLFTDYHRVIDSTLSFAREKPFADSIQALETHFQIISRNSVVKAVDKNSQLLETLRTYQDFVEWGSSGEPANGANDADLIKCLQSKIERNVGQALLETIVLVGSCLAFLENQVAVPQKNFYDILVCSSLIVNRFASLHDKKQITNFEKLLEGKSLVYPEIRPAALITNPIIINNRHFSLYTHRTQLKLTLSAPIVTEVDIDTPTVGCPAHRIIRKERRLNTYFWLLVVNLFNSFGKFGSASSYLNNDKYRNIW